jgi:glycerol-3-phosphate acyltransferase PlsX
MRMLDLGANVDLTPEHLLQFAVMGSVLASAIDNIKNPSVYLLNIGAEEIKGNEQVKQTAEKLAAFKAINYCGFVEGDALYSGHADVVVCDGFVGNVALKTTEGVIHFMRDLSKAAFMRNIFTKLVGLLVKPVLKSAMARLDPARYNGAVLIGLQGNVIKSHGSASIPAFANAIISAIRVAEHKVPEQIRHHVESLLK